MRRYLGFLVLAGLVVLTGVGIWFFLVYCEGEDPEIVLSRDIGVIGQRTPFDITCIDRKSGIRSASVTISQDGKSSTIASLALPARGATQETLAVDLRPADLKLRDGEATIAISVTDFSLRKNTRSVTFEAVIDTIPPQIFPVSAYHYANPGGTCVAAYTLSEAVTRSGVQVNNDFFPSYPEAAEGMTRHISYFAVPIADGTDRNLKMHVLAEDSAGNTTFFPIAFHLRDKKFRNDRMNISQSFLEMKMPEFQHRYQDLQGTTLIDAFSYVNTRMRAQDKETIEAICKDTRPEQLWEGAFLRMKNAATMATFGDRRTYYHNDKEISTSVHMGVDLASTRNAPVEASNTGVVAFTGYIGIYGNTVIIDHGMGVFSLYGHLSSINVHKGQTVKKGEIVGRTGLTGMAGGDHLHFSMIVGGQFVNPVEWWDPHWIQDNVTRKISGEG
ncbi:MAG: M23 family metallopeptidase [Deltaproteobacteria bacterium]|nr:M23 family metallopeptidase [Deltaproteobacteria bacterium]